MRYPLFVLMRQAKKHHLVPKELRHSGILSLEHVRSLPHARLWLFSWETPSGGGFIEAIADRIYRGKIVREQDFRATMVRIAQTIYGGSQVAHFRKNHGPKPPKVACGHEWQDGLRCNGKWIGWDSRRGKTIPIEKAPQKPCRWCGKPVIFKPEWLAWYDKTVRCNAPDCRRMDYLKDKPQSRGGIDLTPVQRRSLDPEAWNTQRAMNYLQLRAKELKRGRSTNHDLR